MKFFIDTADLDEIREAMSWGVLSGVTTNPSLYARTGGRLADFEGHMAEICRVCEGPARLRRVPGQDHRGHGGGRQEARRAGPQRRREAAHLRGEPAGDPPAGLEGIRVNMTLVFSARRRCWPPAPARAT